METPILVQPGKNISVCRKNFYSSIPQGENDPAVVWVICLLFAWLGFIAVQLMANLFCEFGLAYTINPGHSSVSKHFLQSHNFSVK